MYFLSLLAEWPGNRLQITLFTYICEELTGETNQKARHSLQPETLTNPEKPIVVSSGRNYRFFNQYEVMDTMQYNESQSYGQPYAVRSALVSRLSVSTLSADMGGGRFFTCWIYPNPGNPAFTTLTQDSFYRWKASRPGNVHSIGPPWLPEIILPNKIV